MGWRKLTVRDGDLARCCAAQGPIICEVCEACQPPGFFLMRQHHRMIIL
jgi:hypothetical protein